MHAVAAVVPCCRSRRALGRNSLRKHSLFFRGSDRERRRVVDIAREKRRNCQNSVGLRCRASATDCADDHYAAMSTLLWVSRNLTTNAIVDPKTAQLLNQSLARD